MPKQASHYKRIYLKKERSWIEVEPEIYMEYMRGCDRTRHRMQAHGRCVCPRRQFWLCDEDCPTCEFSRAGDVLSLEHELSGEGDDALTMLDTLVDTSPSIEDIISDFDELAQLLHRLAEIMPEAIKVGIMREQGLSESAIAAELGIPRTTLRSRLAKAREQLKPEFPNIL